MNHKKFAHVIRSIAVISLIILALSLVNNCKKGVPQADLIVLTMTETQWGLNYSSSMGHVEVFLQGGSVDGIILASIEMKGDNPSAAPLKAETADFVGGNKVRALFEKNRVLALLASPAEGSIHIVIVSFRTEPSNESFEMSIQVTVSNYVEDGETSSLTLEIDPDEWNLNYIKSAGRVEAFIEGQGIDQIDLDSIEMIGDNPSAAPLAADSTSIKGNHIRARFPKNQVIALLSDPGKDTQHTIIVSFLEIGGTVRIELSDIVSIENEEDVIDPSELELEIEPDEWNLNFTKSSGTVEAFIEGQGIDQIDLSSIEMRGDNPSAAPLAADSASIKGDHVHVKFPKNQVIDLLFDPDEGTKHTIIVSFLEIGGTQRIELSAEISIEDEDDEEGVDLSELELEIEPDEWNLNFSKSSGTVEVFIEGEGIDQIDLSSIEMMGDNPSAAPLAAISASIKGDHIHARFPKNQVIDLLLNPDEDTEHTIIVSFLEIGGTQRLELSAEISIEDEDDDDDGDDDDDDLELKIKPDEWNLNFSTSSGTVEAIIEGEGIDQINLSSFQMKGDNPSAAPLAAISASINGDHIYARFPKNKVIGLLLNPGEDTEHTIIVSFLKVGGTERIELSDEISIEDDDD